MMVRRTTVIGVVTVAMVLVGGMLFGQTDLKTSVKQITYQTAATAEVHPHPQDPGKVLIFSTGLNREVLSGAWVTVEGQPVKYAWLFSSNKPPQVLKPFSPGVFLVEGKLGEKYWLGIGSEIPEIVEVVIGDEPGPIEPPPVEPPVPGGIDTTELRKAVKAAVIATKDKTTANALAEAYATAVLDITGLMTLDQARARVGKARREVGEQGTFTGDWATVLNVAETQIAALKPVTIVEYKQCISALVAAIRDAVAEMTTSGSTSMNWELRSWRVERDTFTSNLMAA